MHTSEWVCVYTCVFVCTHVCLYTPMSILLIIPKGHVRGCLTVSMAMTTTTLIKTTTFHCGGALQFRGSVHPGGEYDIIQVGTVLEKQLSDLYLAGNRKSTT